ncbi:MAG: argininosuccinate lyase [Gammaproteobacteria bacterium]|nr:argininosuccinate lyase [Gammaproteobacteria bacterium]
MQRFPIPVLWILLFTSAPAAAAPHDDFDHLVEINKASLVMLTEAKLLPPNLAADIAMGIEQIAIEQSAAAAARSSNYLRFEKRLLEISGPAASRLHTGRSRQDIGSTYRRMALREALLDSYEALLDARLALLSLAGDHVETIVPAYTHGVQAQPTSFAHYLLAFSAAFERDAERLREVYARLNRSPLGAAALATSGFPIDRPRLAELLGFDAAIENSYDANLVSSVDSKLEFANALSASAIVVGQLMQNIHTQYHDPAPWILLAESQTDVSSIMPQKRNPRPLDRVRSLASSVVGAAYQVSLNAHNTMSGMNDYRPATTTLAVADAATGMYRRYVDVLQHLVIDEQRALEEVDLDYSTMTEVADVLLRHAGVPFRIGHHYASELTRYGRANAMRPKDLSDETLMRIYRETDAADLPVGIDLIRAALSAEAMVAERRGLGGPQPAEVTRMLVAANAALEADLDWLERRREQLQLAETELVSAFDALR